MRRARLPDLLDKGRYRWATARARSERPVGSSPASFAAAILMSAFDIGTPFKQEFPTTSNTRPPFFATRANSLMKLDTSSAYRRTMPNSLDGRFSMSPASLSNLSKVDAEIPPAVLFSAPMLCDRNARISDRVYPSHTKERRWPRR